MDASQIQAAFDEVFDQAVVFHGYTDYLRDYDVFIYAVAAPSTGILPQHLRYRFQHCVRATITTALPAEIWQKSLDERLVDFRQGRDLDGYVWGVRWQALYPGIKLLPDSAEAARWSHDLGIPFHEATIETNGHNITLVFSDLIVEPVPVGHVPFVVSDDEPNPDSPRMTHGDDPSAGGFDGASRLTIAQPSEACVTSRRAAPHPSSGLARPHTAGPALHRSTETRARTCRSSAA